MNNLNSNLYSKRKKKLKKLDWDCSDQFHQKTSLNILHWYPASFITAIPGNIVDVFSSPKEVIWDPFCGSGTTAIESYRKGRQFIGNDINEIAIQITEAKINLLEIRETLDKEIESIESYLMRLQFSKNFNVDLTDYYEVGKNFSYFDELSCWYHPSTLRDLTIMWGSLLKYDCNKKFKNVLKIIFLNIAKIASAQQKTWGHIADNVKPKPSQLEARRYDPFPNFLTRLKQVVKRSKKIVLVDKNGSYNLECVDTRHFSPKKPVELVVTSPPYPSMADYITSQRLAYYWLGYDINRIKDIKSNEIGARFLRHRKNRNSLYLSNMIESLSNVFLHIKKGGHLAMLLPEYKEDDPRREIISEMCAYCSKKMEHLYDIPRNIDEKNRWTPFKKLKTENLVIWGKK